VPALVASTAPLCRTTLCRTWSAASTGSKNP
jgi:hypothetical protein